MDYYYNTAFSAASPTVVMRCACYAALRYLYSGGSNPKAGCNGGTVLMLPSAEFVTWLSIPTG